MNINKMIHSFFEVKRMVKEIAAMDGPFFEPDRFDYCDYIDETLQKFLETPVPEFDEKNPDLFMVYFKLAGALYLIFNLFSMKDSCYDQKRNTLIDKLKESIGRFPRYNWVLYADNLANHFGVCKFEESHGAAKEDVPCNWFHHPDTWLDKRLQSFKVFIDTGVIPESDFSAFYWLFTKFHGSMLPSSFENRDIAVDKSLDSLATYCAYARDESKLYENMGNYALNLFSHIKKIGLPFEKGLQKIKNCGYQQINCGMKAKDLEFIADRRKEAEESGQDFDTLMESYRQFGGATPELDKEKSNLLTTIDNRDELVDLVMYHDFVKASHMRYEPLLHSLLILTNKVFDCEEIKQEELLDSMRTILNQDIEILKKHPYLPMFCYLAIHYLEEEEWLHLFKKFVQNQGQTNNEDDDCADEGELGLVFKDIRECPNLQVIFFFALFDICRISKSGCTDECEDFLAALKRGDWFEPSVQSELFNRILKKNDMDCSVSSDDMTFERYVDKRFLATESILNLVYNVAHYSESKDIYSIVQQVNNGKEHSTVLMYTKVKASFDDAKEGKEKNSKNQSKNKQSKKEFFADFTSDEQKKMKAEFDKMREIDCGFFVPEYTQLIPGQFNKFFSRRFEIKCFLISDVSCVPDFDGCVWNFLQKRDFYLKRNQRMMECGYLNYARDMKTHNVVLLYTESLLNPFNYPDLLRFLFTVMRQLQRDHSLPKSQENERIFKCDRSSRLYSNFMTKFIWTSLMRETDDYIEKKQETELLNVLKFLERCAEANSLDKDCSKEEVGFFQYLAGLSKKIKRVFSANVTAQAKRVSQIASEKLKALQESYDAVSYDLFKNEPNYGSPFLKKCISLLLQVIQAVTSVEGVVDELKKPTDFYDGSEQRPLLTAVGDVTFEEKRDEVEYSESLKRELRDFLDTVYGMSNLRQSQTDTINRNVFHLYGHKIMLYLTKVTLQMTRLNVQELHDSTIS